MANNKVVFGNETLMDLTEDTVDESKVLLGETFHKANGLQATGTLDPYIPTDSAETAIADDDYFPFYDTSASGKRKTLLSNIKAKLKAYFDSLYTSTAVKGDSESTYRTGNVNLTKANIGLGNVGNFKAVSTVASQGLSNTEKSNARANIGAGTSSFSGSYNDLNNKPTIPTVDQTYSATSSNAQSGTAVAEALQPFDAANRRTPQDITSRIQSDSGASLLNAIAEQDLAKYGYSIGDYFESPTNRSLVTQTYSSGSVTTQTVNVKFKYYLADMDAWYGGYDSYEVVGTHHVELFVDCMINRQWHSASDITNVGYDLSALYTYLKGSILDAIKADMKALFGGSTGLEHLLSHQLYLTKSFTACEWVSTYIHTPSEFEVYGGNTFSGNDAQKYTFNKKLALFDKFRFNQILGSGNSMWLYNMYSASAACIVATLGSADHASPVLARRAAGLILLH